MSKQLKVLHVFNTFLPKTEIWALQLISRLSEIASEVFAIHRDEQGYVGIDLSVKESKAGPLIRKKWNLSSYNPMDIFRKLSINYNLHKLPPLIEELSNHISNTCPNILHFHFGDVAARFLPIIEKTKRTVCISFYGQDYEQLPSQNPDLLKLYHKLSLTKAYFICEGPHGKSILEKYGFRPEQIVVLPLGIQTTHQTPLSKKQNTLSLIQIASFTEKKGQLITVQAIQKLQNSCPGIKLTLVGDDRNPGYASTIKKYIKDEKLEHQISIRPFVPYHQISKILRAHHVFIHPSQYAENLDCEGGAPVILMNAQNAGLPVISTTHCDIPAVVRTGYTGILSPEGQVQGIVDSIKTFYEMDPVQYTCYSQNAINWSNECFNIESNAQKYSDFYHKIIPDI